MKHKPINVELKKNQKLRLYQGITFLGTAASFILIFWTSLKLRPVADDFCNANMVTSGVLTALQGWFFTWTGDVTLIVLSTFLVGLPISVSVKLAFISFLIGCLVVATVGSYLLFSVQNRKSWIFSVLFLFTSWSVFLWFPAFMNRKTVPISLQNQIAEQSTFWQIIIAGYVIPIALAVWASLIALRKKLASKSVNSLSIFVLVIVGLMIGTSGPVLAVSIFTAVSLKFATILLAPGKFISRSLLMNFLIFIVSTAIGLSISLFAPGAVIRKTYLPKVSTTDLIRQLPGVLVESLGTLFNLMFSLSSIVAVISGLVICGFYAQKQFLENKDYILDISVFLIIITFFSTLGELYSYKAPWHVEHSVVIQFFLGLLVGKKLFKSLSRKNEAFRSDVLSLLSLSAYFVFSVFGILFFKDQASEFLELWTTGKPFQSLPGYADGWISNCAKALFAKY